MTEKKDNNKEFIGCLFPSDKSARLVTLGKDTDGNPAKRYLLDPVNDTERPDVAFTLYHSLIPGLKGSQVRDLDCYQQIATVYKRDGQYGEWYVSSKDEDGKAFIINTKNPERVEAKWTHVILKEKEAYVKKEEEAPKAATKPEAKPVREFA